MKKLYFISCFLICVFTSMSPADINGFSDEKKFPSLLSTPSDAAPEVTHWVDSLYTSLRLDSMGLNKDVFFLACKGYQYLLIQNKLNNKDLLTICDYSQSSRSKRLYVIDMKNSEVLFHTYVSHGKNSGSEYATNFSNSNSSHKSSLGFMITDDTYFGRAGYSLHFDGVEPGFNSNVRRRDIVMHGSNYVNDKRADEGEIMGRSYGCPAVPYSQHKKIIDKIKGGSCFFAYSSDDWYLHTSKILNAAFTWPVASVVAAPQVQVVQQPIAL